MMRNARFPALCFALASACLALCAAAYPAEAQDAIPRKVFAHFVPWHPPTHARPDRTMDTWGGGAGQIRHAAAAGIDGFAVDIVLRPPVSFLPSLLSMAKTAAAEAPGFAIMPCLDLAASTEPKAWIEFLKGWCEQSRAIPAAYRLNGRAVVFTYAAYRMTAAQWEEVRAALRADGHEVVLIGEMDAIARTNPAKYAATLPEMARALDGLYFFSPLWGEPEERMRAALAQAARETGKPRIRIASPSPGYWRVDSGSFSRRYKGTETYRATWNAALESGVDWISLTTWNDYTENTQVEPSRMFSDLYARMTRLYAARFRREPVTPSIGAETFWLTAPAEISDGPGAGPLEAVKREPILEVYRLAPREAPCSGWIRVVDAAGKEIHRRSFTLSGTPEASFAFEWEPEEALNTRHLWIEAEVRGGDGKTLTGRLPVPVWPRDLARRFNMSPRRIRLAASHPKPPTLQIKDGRLVAAPLPEPEGVRVDLLHNLSPRLSPRSKTAAVAEGLEQIWPAPLAWGFYEGAVTTKDGRVAWAEPVWLPAVGDGRLLALWRFDDAGQAGRDESIYARHARIHGGEAALTTLRDGSRALASGTNVWAAPPGSFCPTTAPITIELWARPANTEGGMLWGDVGAAMLLSLTKTGVPEIRRIVAGTGRWVGAAAKAPLPTDKWSHIAGVYDGERLRLYVNGQPAAEAACTGGAGSSRMGIGRNPYDGSSVFNGLVDDVRISAGALAPEAFGPVNPLRAQPSEP